MTPRETIAWSCLLLGLAGSSVPIFGFDPATLASDPPVWLDAVLLALCLAAFTWLLGEKRPGVSAFDREPFEARRDLVWLALAVALAAWTRFDDLARRPWGSEWVEGVAATTFEGSWKLLIAPFDSGMVETGWMLPLQLCDSLAANPVAGARLAAAIAGTLGIALLYLMARLWTGRATATAAALLLCFDWFHLYCSRTAQPYIYVPTLHCLALICLTIGLRRRSRAWLAASGIFAGLLPYMYLAGPLGLLTVFAAVAMLCGFDWDGARDQTAGLKAMALAALAVLLPLAAAIARYPQLYASHPFEMSRLTDGLAPIEKLLGSAVTACQLVLHLFGVARAQHHAHLTLGPVSVLAALGLAAFLFARRDRKLDTLAAVTAATVLFGLLPYMLVRPGFDEVAPRRYLYVLPFVAIFAAIGLRTFELMLRERFGRRLPVLALSIAALLAARPVFLRHFDARVLLDMQSEREYLLVQAAAELARERHVMLGEWAIRGQIAPVYDVPCDIPFVAGAFGVELFPAGDVFPAFAVERDVSYVTEGEWVLPLLRRYFPGGREERRIARHLHLEREVGFYTVPAAAVRALQGLSQGPDGAWHGALRIPRTGEWLVQAEQAGGVTIQIDGGTPGKAAVVELLHEGWHEIRVTSPERPALWRRRVDTPAWDPPPPGRRGPADRPHVEMPQPPDVLRPVPEWDLLRVVPAEPEVRAPRTAGRERWRLERKARAGWTRPDRGIMQELASASGRIFCLQSGEQPLVAFDRDLNRSASHLELRAADGAPIHFPSTGDPFDWFSLGLLPDGRFLLSRTFIPDLALSHTRIEPESNVWLFGADGRLQRELGPALGRHNLKAVAAGAGEDSLYLAMEGHGIARFDVQGKIHAVTPGHDPVSLAALGGEGVLFVDALRQTLVRIGRDGAIQRQWRYHGGTRAARLALDSSRRVWVLLPTDRVVAVYSLDGELLGHPIELPPARPDLDVYHHQELRDIELDAAGRLFVAYRFFENGIVAFDVNR